MMTKLIIGIEQYEVIITEYTTIAKLEASAFQIESEIFEYVVELSQYDRIF